MESESRQPDAAPVPPASPAATSPAPVPAAQNIEPAAAASAAPPPKQSRWRLPIILLIAAILLVFALPKFLRSLHTASTDDAYVNSYVTLVAPRVSGQVARVLVDDNNRVKKGDVLVQLDSEPYRVQVAIQQAYVDSAQADLIAAEANVRALIGQVRSARFKLEHAIEDVDNQIAQIRNRVATLEQAKATLALAQEEFDRSQKLISTKVVSVEENDQKRSALNVAKAQASEALEAVEQARVNLGLPGTPPKGGDLSDVPADLDQTASSVREALSVLLQGAAQLNIIPSSYNLTPRQVVEEFYRRDPKGDIDRIYATIIKEAPAIKQARAALQKAQRSLDEANLELRYCTVVAEIDGVVTRRNVNPGNGVQAGQSLMAIRSLRDVWIDANFKETQLRGLRIGLPVEVRADMYGGTQTFRGRISGFTNGTGSTLALLPAENATGNFVKVVQRLPVRIDLIDYDPDKVPLFVGLSVSPVVDLSAQPGGPDAGKFLQATDSRKPAVAAAAVAAP